jgi:hypothetical protein
MDLRLRRLCLLCLLPQRRDLTVPFVPAVIERTVVASGVGLMPYDDRC